MSIRCLLARVLVFALMAVVTSGSVRAQAPGDLAALNAQVVRLYGQGKYAEATEIAKQSLAIAEKELRSDHPDVATALNNLAALYNRQGRYAEAEPLYNRNLALREKALGPDHPEVATALNNLAGLYENQGRYAEAEPLYKRSLALRGKALGPDHPVVAQSLNNLAALYQSQGRADDAEPLYKRSLALREKALGPNHPDVGESLNNLASLYRSQGRYTETEPLLKRSLALREKALGADHPVVGMALNNLAVLYRDLGRAAEAEPLYRRSLALHEKALGSDHPDVGQSLNNLALLYRSQGRYTEAEPLLKRSLALREKALGPDHSDVGHSLNNLAELYKSQGRNAEAEPLYKRSLALYEKALGPDHPDVGTALNNLALLYGSQGRYAEAEPLLKRSLALREKALGPDHPDVATSLNNLAVLLTWSRGRTGEAEPLFKRSLALREKALGPDHPEVGSALNNLAALYLAQRDWASAANFWRRSTALTVRRVQRGTANSGTILSSRGKSEAEQLSGRFSGLIKVLNRFDAEQPGNATAVHAETFATAQWAQGSEAAASLAQMAARGAAGNPGLATIIRERQDLVVEWQRRDSAHAAALAQPTAKRDVTAVAANVGRLAEIDTRIANIDRQLASEFPDYAALASPQPLTVEQVRADLRTDEALVLFLDTPKWDPTPEETFVWVVTKTDARWVRSELGTPSLTREVAALRCGLDTTAWHGEGALKCLELLGLAPDKLPELDAPLPFEHARAHKLYMALFGKVSDLIKDKHLLLVTSGPLTQLPFQVLVTEFPTSGDHKSIRWLARNHALTVLPAVSSLKVLRRVAKPSAAQHPMIGFGNPLLDGDQEHPQYGTYFKEQAALARAHNDCTQAVGQRTAALRGASRSPAPITQQSGLADVAQLRRQAPLPETADELCAVARDLRSDVGQIRIGARATEREIKALSAGGRLADYRIVHFATHGTLAGQLSGTHEPGLILTPPDTGSSEDDGYLSASEIASLKLDADWVILSACNTAAGSAAGGESAEALSGLARAFFYAQARALLVSHWEVNSLATVKLITAAVRAITRDNTVGRSEALRLAMLDMIDNGKPEEAHPAYWAPFVVVGEGASAP